MTPGSDTPDARRFRNTIGLFATGVAVVAARIGEDVIAMTANAVASVSLDPMLVLFCPERHTRLAHHLDRMAGFTISLLRDDQQPLSTFFAGGWKDPTPPPFQFVHTRTALRLEGSLASIDCDLERTIEAGDHWIVVGRVVGLHIGPEPHRPLLFFRGQYRHVVFTESTPAPDLANPHDAPFDLTWY
jgi:flavin reductase (DIM6/NTAB) family NADH-FMN oxidoreductase RutF